MNKKEKQSLSDFKSSMITLIKQLKPWRVLLIISILLGMIASILSSISPKILSNFADTIGAGLKVDVNKIVFVSNEIKDNIKTDNIKDKLNNIYELNLNDEELKEVYNKVDKFIEDDKNGYYSFLSLPDEVLLYLIDDIKLENKKISSKDQISFLRLIPKTDEEIKNVEVIKLVNDLPVSIYSIVKPKINMDKIKTLSITLGVILIISALFNYIQGYSLATVCNRFANVLRDKISKKINRLPLKYFDTHKQGNVLSIITNDVDTISFNLNNSMHTLSTSLTLFISSLLMMFITNWIMAITAIMSSLIGFFLMSLILSKSQKYFKQRQEALGNMNGYIEEVFSGHVVVKTYNGVNESINNFNTLNKTLYETNKKSQFLSRMMHPIMGFIGTFSYVMVCIVGTILTINNIVSFGVVVAFMVYVRLFTNPLVQIAQAMTYLQSISAASLRVFNFLDEEEMSNQEEIKKHLNKSKIKGEIEFRNVKFGYDKDKMIINDFNIKIKPGQRVAIVGPTGAGKTTIVNLLMKFYELNDGDILIDGVSIKELSRENIHDLFIMVLQDTWLFQGSIADNIKFNNKNVTKKEITSSLNAVGINHFVNTLPGKIDFLVSDNETISQGQKQLLTIARAMIKDAPFLILDEATSNVDTRTERLVSDAMDKLTKGRTSFIIAHRLSTIKNADLILVMNDGSIVEKGTHEELIKKNGTYASLYNSQFELN